MSFDVAIIGSGFGGSVSALRLAEKGYRVAVIEAGSRFASQDFPKTSWHLRKFLWAPRLGMRGIQRLTLLRDVLVLSGAGVGGGSLVYANTLYEPHDAFYIDPQWGEITDWKEELRPYYDQARRMLGVTDAHADTPADAVLRAVGRELGVEDTFRSTPVGVWIGKPGVTVDDPFFGGIGPAKTGCIECGGCMAGCRHGAKNTLDRNYLYLAEKAGVQVFADTEVTDLDQTEDGFRLTTGRPGAWIRKRTQTFEAAQVIFSAGALGSTRLLLELREAGKLPAISSRLGDHVRTNSEAILGASARFDEDTDYSRGVAITSSIHPDHQTHIEPVRYGKGSNAMGLLGTILVDGGGRIPRQLRFLTRVLLHPVTFLRSLSVRRWSERTVILLVMQSLNNQIRLRLGKSGRLVSNNDESTPNPAYIPVANEAARLAAQAMGGFPGSALNEVLFDTPTTAHIIGGACIGAGPDTGVIDAYHRVHGCPGLHVIDGAAVPANLGVNPALSITALAERAIALWPNRGEEDPRPAPGHDYVRLQAVPPRHPTVPSDAPAALRV